MAEQMKKSSNGHAQKGSKMHMPHMSKGAAVTTMAGVAGAVVGAGVAVAATQILSDKNARAKVKQTFNKVKTQVMDTIQEEQKRMNASTASQKKLGNGTQTNKKSPGKKSSKPEMATGPQISV